MAKIPTRKVKPPKEYVCSLDVHFIQTLSGKSVVFGAGHFGGEKSEELKKLLQEHDECSHSDGLVKQAVQ